MVLGPPSSGKTTVVKNLVNMALSSGLGWTPGVIGLDPSSVSSRGDITDRTDLSLLISFLVLCRSRLPQIRYPRITSPIPWARHHHPSLRTPSAPMCPRLAGGMDIWNLPTRGWTFGESSSMIWVRDGRSVVKRTPSVRCSIAP